MSCASLSGTEPEAGGRCNPVHHESDIENPSGEANF